MAGPIRVELSETALAVSPGGAVTTRCTVYNTSLNVDEYPLQVTGVESSWVDLPATTARIFPDAIETVTVTFHPPRSPSVAAGAYPFEVVAISTRNPAITASASGTLNVDPFVDFELDVASPRQVTTEIEATFTLRIANTGNSPIDIALDASEETGQLEFFFSDPAPSIPGNQASDVTFTARPNAKSIGTSAYYSITVAAAITGVRGVASAPELRHALQVTVQTLPGVYEPPVLSPQSVELDGQHARTLLVLRNRSALPMSVGLSATDKAHALDFEFVGGDQVTVPPQGSLDVPIRITCVDRTLLAQPPTPTSYRVVVTPIHPSGDPRTIQGEVTLPSPADFRLRLEPEIVESTVAQRVQLVIENVSPRAETFLVSATSKDASLEVGAATERVEVAARSEVTLPIELIPKFEALSTLSAAKTSGYTVRVVPEGTPSRSNEVTGQYVFTPASLTLKLKRKEIEAVAEATFDVEIENGGKHEVTVALDASDRLGACAYAFDLSRVRIAGRSSALVRLTVTPPAEHKPDARWEFAVEAKPVSAPGTTVQDTGVLIYRSASVKLTVLPVERRGRRRRTYQAVLVNPMPLPMSVRITTRDHSGGLGVGAKRDSVNIEPSQTVRVPVKVTPRRRPRGSGEASLSFTIVATPVTPPGDATTAEGTFVALPPRSRWIWVAALFALLLAFLFLPVYKSEAYGEWIPLYEQTFYWSGWEPSRTWVVVDAEDLENWEPAQLWTVVDAEGNRVTYRQSGRHRFPDDISCIVRRVIDGDSGLITDLCFAQGPKVSSTTASE